MSIIDDLLDYAFRASKRTAGPHEDENLRKKIKLEHDFDEKKTELRLEFEERKHRLVWDAVHKLRIGVGKTTNGHVRVNNGPFEIHFNLNGGNAQYKIKVWDETRQYMVLKASIEPVQINNEADFQNLLQVLYMSLNEIISSDDNLKKFIKSYKLTEEERTGMPTW
jgi:hypothetical protein